MKHKTLYKFIGQTVLYFAIFLALLYFFSYLGQGQGGGLSTTNFRKETLAVSNQPITDMIERQLNVMRNYNQTIRFTMSLVREHTYGQLKADSDSLAAPSTKWDFLKSHL